MKRLRIEVEHIKKVTLNLPDKPSNKIYVQYTLNDKADTVTLDYLKNLEAIGKILQYEIVTGLTSAYAEVYFDGDIETKEIHNTLKPLIDELCKTKYKDV